MFSTLYKANFKSSVTFILSSANTINLDKPKILSFGNELNSGLNTSLFVHTCDYITVNLQH